MEKHNSNKSSNSTISNITNITDLIEDVPTSLVIVSVTMIVLRIAYSFNHRSTLYFYKEFWTFIGIVYLLLLYDYDKYLYHKLNQFHDVNAHLFHHNIQNKHHFL